MAFQRASRQGPDWEALARSNYPAVWRFCAALTGPAAADDLAQETFLRATRALPRFRGEAKPSTWLLAIARNVCADHLRGRYRRERGEAALPPRPATVPDPGDAVTARDLITGLEHDRRAAFVLTQMLGLTYPEAATVCNCPVGTIRSRVARAREDLIVLMDDGRTDSASGISNT